MMNSNVPYALRGMTAVPTESSTLVSSSRFLNEPRLREWIATHCLRRSGKDIPTTADMYQLGALMRELHVHERIEELFTAERKAWPELDRWLSDGFISTFTVDDLLDYPPGSLGHIFGSYIQDNNFEVQIIPPFEPKSQHEYYILRSAQTHDLEHIVFGGGFNILGELIPYYARLSNTPRFLGAELSGHVNIMQVLGSTRVMVRTGLHYHQAFPTALKATQHGMRVGEEAGPIFMYKFEDLFHLTIAEVRQKLGLTTAFDFDSQEASLAWDEYR
jgi:Uncharacterized protein involved in ubiquinone biosynthesis